MRPRFFGDVITIDRSFSRLQTVVFDTHVLAHFSEIRSVSFVFPKSRGSGAAVLLLFQFKPSSRIAWFELLVVVCGSDMSVVEWTVEGATISSVGRLFGFWEVGDVVVVLVLGGVDEVADFIVRLEFESREALCLKTIERITVKTRFCDGVCQNKTRLGWLIVPRVFLAWASIPEDVNRAPCGCGVSEDCTHSASMSRFNVQMFTSFVDRRDSHGRAILFVIRLFIVFLLPGLQDPPALLKNFPTIAKVIQEHILGHPHPVNSDVWGDVLQHPDGAL